MYKHETINPHAKLVDYDCPVCNQPKNIIITNFRVDLCKGDKLCILGNDLLVDRICIQCLQQEMAQWNASN